MYHPDHFLENRLDSWIICRVKSREELEEEELAKMPKFKARPLNKMVRTLWYSLSTSHHIEAVHFMLFRALILETQLHINNIEGSRESWFWYWYCSSKNASYGDFDFSIQLLVLYPQIFESKGDLGVPRNQKREVTTPQVRLLLTYSEVIGAKCTAWAIVLNC